MADRRIHLLTDEEIGNILSGLHLLNGKLSGQDDKDGVLFNNFLYDKIEQSADIGIIFEGRKRNIERKLEEREDGK